MKNNSMVKILIIEDEVSVRMSMAAYLEDHGYNILEAENGRIGLEIFRHEVPDLILVDLRMPEVDGLEVLSTVTEESPDTPIIVVSGTGVIGDAVEALRLGSWDYVLKPIRDMEVLLHAVQRALERSRLLIENKIYQERLEELVKERTAELEKEIEQRRLTEEALRESEERYRMLISTASEGVWMIDTEMRTMFVNRQMAKMLGYTVEEMTGRTITEFLDEKNAAMFRHKFKRRKEGHGEQYDMKFCCKDGSEIWGIVNANPLFGSEGEVVGGFAMVTDVTERKLAENAIKESEESYRTLSENLPGMVYRLYLRENNRMEFFNDMLKTMTGYQVEELFQGEICNIDNLILPEDRPQTIQTVKDVVLKGEAFEVEYRIKHKNGNIKYFIERGRPICEQDGKPLHIDGVILDQTDSKQAELALQVEREQLLSIFNNINEIIYVADPETYEILYANDFLIKTFKKNPVGGICYQEFQGLDFPCDFCTNEIILKNKYQPYQWEYHNPVLNRDFMITDSIIKWSDGRDVRFEITIDITDRKHAEKALRESEEKYRHLVESTMDLVWVCSVEGRHTYINQAVKHILGYEDHEVIGASVFEHIYIEDRQRVKELFKEAVEHKRGWKNTVLRWQHKDGSVKFLETKAQPIFDGEGNLVGYSGIDRDITERKRIEAELLRGKNFTDLVLNSLPGIFYLFDENGNMKQWNRNLEVVSGYSADEIRRMKPMDFFVQDEKERVAQRIQEAFTTGKSEVEASLETKDDSNIPHYFTGYRMVINGKNYLLGIGIDISGQKQAEDRLRESEKRYRAVVEDMPAMICRFTRDGVLTFVNSSYCKYFNKKPEELIGQNFFQFIPEEERKKVRNHFLSLDQNMPMSTYEHQVIIPDGSIRWQEWTDRALFEEKGHAVEYQSIGRDITEVKLAQEERAKIQKQLQQAQKMEAIGTLAGGIAHDFNNILFPIIGFSEMTLDDLPEDSPLRSALNEILNGAKRARSLVKQILSFSRQSDQMLKPLKLQHIIREVLKLIRSSLPSTIKIKQFINNKCGLVMADPTQIHQIAMNLMTNAYHAMQETGGELEVILNEVELEINALTDPTMSSGPYACLTIADTGIGMNKSVLDRIFDPYFSTKGKDKGTGLGLAIVHGIIKSYKGDIKVYSEPGKGSVFHVYLPVIKEKIDTLGAETFTPIEKGTERILFVDDEVQIVRMVKLMLERLGYHVTSRTSSTDALDAFRAAPDKFDLVITDMTMPNMTGVQLVQNIQAIRSNMPIIICTGFSEQISKDKARDLGIGGYVMKPVIQSEIAKTIRDVLDGKQKS